MWILTHTAPRTPIRATPPTFPILAPMRPTGRKPLGHCSSNQRAVRRRGAFCWRARSIPRPRAGARTGLPTPAAGRALCVFCLLASYAQCHARRHGGSGLVSVGTVVRGGGVRRGRRLRFLERTGDILRTRRRNPDRASRTGRDGGARSLGPGPAAHRAGGASGRLRKTRLNTGGAPLSPRWLPAIRPARGTSRGRRPPTPRRRRLECGESYPPRGAARAFSRLPSPRSSFRWEAAAGTGPSSRAP